MWPYAFHTAKRGETGMELTVEQALQIGALAHCKLLGGSGGIQHKISWVDTMEIPEIAPWLKKHELLITTGYAIKNDSGALAVLLRDLHRVQAAGIAIKTRFLGSISAEAVALADSLDVPLIEIPPDIPFVEITHPLMKALVDEHNSRLEFSEQMNAKFLELELNDGGVAGIGQTLSHLIDRPVMIVAADYTVLTCCSQRFFEQDSYVTVDAAGTQRLNAAIGDRIRNRNTPQRLDGCAGATLLVRSAAVKKQVCGYLIVVCREELPDEMQEIAINHAVVSLALEFAKRQVLENNARMMGTNLFIDLLNGNISFPDEAEYRAQMLHWPPPPLRVAIVDGDQFEQLSRRMEEADIQQLKEQVCSLCQRELSSRGVHCTILMKSDSFTCLMDAQYGGEALQSAMESLVVRIRNTLSLQVTVGISEVCRSYLQLPDAYSDARDAIAIGRRRRSPKTVVDIADAHLEQVLLQTADSPYVQRFVQESIGKLVAYDHENGTELLQTLAVLIENMGSRKKTAEALFLHRNTLANRIRKLEEITGYHLDKSHELFSLGLAIRFQDFC